MELFSYENVKANGNIPRVHGNGFIQLDLRDGYRMNIWPDKKLVTQKVSTQIHNHRFSFISTVVLGKLINATIEMNPTERRDFIYMPLYNLYKAVVRKDEDTRLELVDDRIYQKHIVARQVIKKGESYNFSAYAYHETYGARGILTATIMHKTYEGKQVPYVACEVGKQPDNDFNRYQYESGELWFYVKRVFTSFKNNCISII